MNGEKTNTGNHGGHTWCAMPIHPMAAARKPSGIDPASPMKRRAGGKFSRRKPTDADDTTAAHQPNGGSTFHQAQAKAPKPIAAMPPASPSAPSMKLKRLVDHTIASAPNAARSSG